MSLPIFKEKSRIPLFLFGGVNLNEEALVTG
jgi:hypothetical protein